MALGVQLERVRSRTGERVHLAALAEGDIQTLCGLTFKAGAYAVTERPADCRTCLRRQDDPARISSALFASDQGARLLELSLQQARERRETPSQRSAPDEAEIAQTRFRVLQGTEPQPEPPAEPAREPEPEPEPVGELDPRGFRRFSDNTFTSPAGVIVRISRGRVAEVTYEGGVHLLRRAGDSLALRLGDVELTYSAAAGRLVGVARIRP